MGKRRAAGAALALLALLAVPGCAPRAGAGGIPGGRASGTAVLPAATLPVATYRPANCAPRLVLLVFHGVERDEAAYRDHAVPLADRVCAVVVAPRFAAPQFARDRYQYGGLDARPGLRTVDIAAALSAWAVDATGPGRLPVVMLGHSAGAQFLDRVAALRPDAADRFVLANPSTWMLPDIAHSPPFGFDGLPQATALIRAYLGAPVAVVVGGADTGTRNLASGDEAMAQGPNRLERARRAFAAARAASRREGAPLGWRYAEVAGVGHDAARMFASVPVLEAVSAVPAPAR